MKWDLPEGAFESERAEVEERLKAIIADLAAALAESNVHRQWNALFNAMCEIREISNIVGGVCDKC